MKIIARKVAATKTHDAYDIQFELVGSASAIFRSDDASIDVRTEVQEAVIEAIRKCKITIIDGKEGPLNESGGRSAATGDVLESTTCCVIDFTEGDQSIPAGKL